MKNVGPKLQAKLRAKAMCRAVALICLPLVTLTQLPAAHASDGARAGEHADQYPLPQDVGTLDGLMRAYYEVVSGPANTARNVARDRSLHHPDAVLMVPVAKAGGSGDLQRFSVAEFHEWSKPTYAPGFYEQEIKREVRRYGNTYHVFSFYDTRRTADGPSIGRGINSIQLYFDGKRFWILSETWASESAGNPLPSTVEVLK